MPLGVIRISNVKNYLAIGPFTRRIQSVPNINTKFDSHELKEEHLICIPKDGNLNPDEMLWVVFKDKIEMKFVKFRNFDFRYHKKRRIAFYYTYIHILFQHFYYQFIPHLLN